MHDFRLAFRSLRSTPVVNTVAVLSLALGIGANTAIFSVVDSLVLRSLPVSEPQRLFMLSTNVSGTNRPQFSYSALKQIRNRVTVFDGALGYTSCCGKSIVTGAGAHEMVDRQFVTGDFFNTLGVRAFRGRLLTPADDEPGAPDGPVAVISHRYWKRLGGRNEAVGAALTIDGTLVTIVGVAPPDFFGVEVGRVVDLLIPQRLAGRLTSSPFDDDNAWLNVIVRLKPGISVAAASGLLRGAQPQIRAASTPTTFPNARFLQDPFTLEPAAAGMSALRQRFERPLVVIFVLVSLVLLIACANIANLLLARGVARRHELSVRVALGASRWRLVRQFLAESLLLSSVGAAIGLVLASWATRALLSQLSSARAPVVLETAVDWRVLAFTMTTMVTTAILFGTAPALRLTNVVPIEALKVQGRGMIGDRRTAVSNSLVVVQIALSLLLVVGAGLFVQTFERLVRVSLGFDPDRTLVVMVTAPTVPADDRPMLFHRLAEAVRTVPGVTGAGGALNPPIIGGLAGDLVVSAPGAPPPPDAERIPQFDSITPGWFAGYGIPIERGRDFDERDTIGAPPVMLVNDSFVRRLFPGRDVVGVPLAMTFRFATGDFPYGVRTIVGVVGDSVFRSIREPVRPMIYVPLAQRESIPQKDMYLGVRSAGGSPAMLERGVAAAITAFNGNVAFSFQPLAQQVDESLANDRVMAMLSGFFGGLALLLAALGLYGVTAYGVAQRRAEIGVRMALGAAPANIMRLVLTRVSMLVTVGVAVGALTSVWATSFVSSLLFGLEPHDPATLLGAAAILAATGSIAGWLPAYRASRIDPSQVLRDA